ncbi:MAG: GTPase HflX [Ezakiella sp.]|uniref:GTPase HflX n=1 Tax=Ezakiella sp. TaxID=1935205 RepID=UPI00297039CE|nr:GTPase HflX [Ezakiella sp.]MDD7730694.1 GTPase HflX [Eubacteriales bacterium]MDY6080039.1 GTPase HflX [Ezakiella sp.]
MDFKDKKAIIIANDISEDSPRQKENIELVKSLGAEVISVLIQNIQRINPKYYFGSGKIEYFSNISSELKADFVVVCEDLSPRQLQNVKDEFDMLVIDRNQLILELFNQRATTAFGKLQVELATLSYMYPRLRGMRKDMDRQFGVMGMRGAGEQKLELDRRVLRKRIDKLKEDVKAAQVVLDTKSKMRTESSIPIVSLIGYSNTGKSTLLNRIIELSGADEEKSVYADDRLFATLDTHARRIELPHGGEMILTDTVGLISDLPHQLVDAFRSTLSEIKSADLLVQVLDISNKNLDVEIETTEELIKELGLGDKKIIKVYNKADKVTDKHIYADADMVISAYNDADVLSLLTAIELELYGEAVEETKFFPYSEAKELSLFMERNGIISKKYSDEGTEVTYIKYLKRGL